MKTVATIGLDIAKQVFQVHGADMSGGALRGRNRSEGRRARVELNAQIIAVEPIIC
ncbi:MAG: hypothetical protein ACLQHF_05750 [Terracidiphilus sp.]